MSREQIEDNLCQIVKRNPIVACDSSKCRKHLEASLKGGDTTDISYLVSAIEKGITAQILKQRSPIKSDRLKKESILLLQENSDLNLQDAQWVIRTWLEALKPQFQKDKSQQSYKSLDRIPMSDYLSNDRILIEDSFLDPKLMALWLEQSGDREIKELVKLAQKGKPLPPEKKELLYDLINNPKDLYASMMATKDVKNHAELTTVITNFANLIDFVSNSSFYWFAFKPFFFPIGTGVLSLVSNGLVLVFSNKVATVAANKTKHGSFWANAGVGTMIALALLKSSVSGVGGELMMNQPELKKNYAQELIDEQQKKVKEIKELGADDELEARKKELREKDKELNSFERTHPRWDSLYIELYGSWADRDRNWSSVPKEQLPLSPLVKRLEAEAAQAYQIAKTRLDGKLVKRSQIGNDLIFLEQEMPYVFQGAFDDNGDIASGTKAIELATENFFGKLLTLQWSSLGFSLFFFSLSVITSAASVLLTIRYANRQDVKESWIQEEQASKLLDELLVEVWSYLVKNSDSYDN